MSVFEDLLGGAQPNYVAEVRKGLLHLMDNLGEAPFAGVDKVGFTDRALDLLTPGPAALEAMIKLSELNWWCGLPIGDAAHGRMAALGRASIGETLRGISVTAQHADPSALRRHAVFAGSLLHVLHSPTRGAVAYARALAALPETEAVEVLHTKPMTAETRVLADEVLGGFTGKVRFEEVFEDDPEFLLRAIQGPQRTYHLWCEHPFVMLPSFLALFGPTLSLVCADGAPVQYSDVYWYTHAPEYISAKWAERAAPAAFAANYRQVSAVPYVPLAPRRVRPRHELGLGPDDLVLATIGNRIGAEMDQAYVDGMAATVLDDPRLKWLFVGPLQDYWTDAFTSVLGPQFKHVSFDHDLPSLLAHVDVFANPFRVGGGNTAIMAIEAGAVVLTRGDMGDVPTCVPAAHRARDAEAYFELLDALIDSPALRDAWRVEQGALMARRLDGAHFEVELAEMCRLAFDRFAARTPVRLETVLAIPPGSLAAAGG